MASLHRVVVLALPGVIPFELGIPARIFGRAYHPGEIPAYEVLTCSASDTRAVPTDSDFSITLEHGPELLATADTVVIPASHELGSAYSKGYLDGPVAEAFAQIRPGTRLISICTGSYILAAAGVLDGLRATTHWRNAAHFQRIYPQVIVDPNVLFVDEGNVLTSAGVAAGIDLCLHVIRRDLGSEVANVAARRCVVPPWRDGGQAQYIEQPVPAASTTSTAAARAWALNQLDRQVSLAELAREAKMSVRTFTRRFRDEVGMSPSQWLIGQRVQQARRMLESTDLPIDLIARRSGFGTSASLRLQLNSALGVSPMTYRRTFRVTESA